MNALIRRSSSILRGGSNYFVAVPQISETFSTLEKHGNTQEVELPKPNPTNTDARKGTATENVIDVVDEYEIHPEWLAMERRLAFRKPKLKGEIQ